MAQAEPVKRPELTVHSSDEYVPRAAREPSRGWSGMVVFAAVMMMLVGVFNLIDGLVALLNDQWFVATKSGLLLLDFTTWGWILVGFGAFAFLVGLTVLTGRTWARVAGVVLLGLNAAAQLAFVSAYPMWSVVMIAVDVIAIYALIAHGRELAEA